MTLAKFIETNLWAIISAGIMALLAYVIGTTKTAESLTDLDKRTTVLETRAEQGVKFHNCVVRHIDRLESGMAGPRPCELEGM